MRMHKLVNDIKSKIVKVKVKQESNELWLDSR